MKYAPILATAREKTKEHIIVKGGLHYLSGNEKPYFTITADLPGLGMWSCCHDEIKESFGDRFDDLIALRLSNIYGVPMYAVENGWYWAGGTHCQKGDVVILAEHLRISIVVAEEIIKGVLDNTFTKENLAGLIEMLKPQWQVEAGVCIAHHDLKIFGDPYPGIKDAS